MDGEVGAANGDQLVMIDQHLLLLVAAHALSLLYLAFLAGQPHAAQGRLLDKRTPVNARSVGWFGLGSARLACVWRQA